MSKPRPFAISKEVVWEAYLRVKANQGAAGVDEQSIEEFERNLKGNLYKVRPNKPPFPAGANPAGVDCPVSAVVIPDVQRR